MYENEEEISPAWIYIAVDMRDMSICKVGLTTQDHPFIRVKQGATFAPFCIHFNAYDLSRIGVSKKELGDFERFLHKKLGTRLYLAASERQSEWVTSTPFEAEEAIEYYIANGFRVSGQSFYDEWGDIRRDLMNSIVEKFRPNPFLIEQRHGISRCEEYIKYLVDYHGMSAEWQEFTARIQR